MFHIHHFHVGVSALQSRSRHRWVLLDVQYPTRRCALPCHAASCKGGQCKGDLAPKPISFRISIAF